MADLTDGRGGPADAAIADALGSDWKRVARIDGLVPPSWTIAQALIAAGAQGALVPSAQNPGGTNVVLWRWHAAGGPDDGATLTVLDPDAALSR